jgi:adenylate kinase
MRLILLGPPGSGKGTQAKFLSSKLQLEHIATGDVLRAAIKDMTEVGRRAKPYYDAGQLAPDEIVNDLIAERFRRPDRPGCFILDGYPRTIAQARALDEILRPAGLDLSAVILLNVEDDEIVRRLEYRWLCPNTACKAVYHTQNKPPKVAGKCDECGSALTQRADDKPETVRARLKVYHKDTVELIPYYRAKGLLHEVPAQGSIEQISERITKELKPLAGSKC